MGVMALFQLLKMVSFETISQSDSYFIHRYVIIGQVPLRVKSTNYYGSYGPFSTLKNGFVGYLLKRLVYWIHILYTGI